MKLYNYTIYTIDLPKNNLEDFLYFDEKLKTDVDLLKKLVRIISKLVQKYCS